MSEELTRECPQCGTERSYYLVARTNLHLGLKTKWSCAECDHGIVRIDGEVDTGASA